MSVRERMSGNEAVAYAIKQVNPDVMPAFPITPSTEIPQMVSTYIANGQMDTEFIPVESEHSSMSATIGAEAAGARSLTATSSAGLALMWEELLLAASNRMPCVLTLVNRTLSGPININCDHSDGMGARLALNIYCQLGLLMLIGLTAKSAILMAEYAMQKEEEGLSPTEAAIEGFKQRFRSVQMTVLSFVIGVLPLLVATGAGANARHAVGVTTFWGMVAATVVGLLFVPPLYVLVRPKKT